MDSQKIWWRDEFANSRISRCHGLEIPCYGHSGDETLHTTPVMNPAWTLEEWHRKLWDSISAKNPPNMGAAVWAKASRKMRARWVRNAIETGMAKRQREG